MRALLLGSDHTELGQVKVAAVGERSALGLTRGRFKKSYRYVDPNEDVAAAVVGPRATLLVVADAHNGVHAGETAVEEVLAAWGADPPPADVGDVELVTLVHRVNEAVLTRTRLLSGIRTQSRTTLAVALVTVPDPGGGRVLQHAAMGDSAVIVASPGVGEDRTRARHHFVGWPMSRPEIAGVLQRGRRPLEPDEWVVVVSDGFTNFIGPHVAPTLVASVVGDHVSAEDVAAELIEAAGRAGAGDNVAVAVCAPPAAPS